MTNAQFWFLFAVVWWLSCMAAGFWLTRKGEDLDRLLGTFAGHSFAAISVLLVMGFMYAGGQP